MCPRAPIRHGDGGCGSICDGCCFVTDCLPALSCQPMRTITWCLLYVRQCAVTEDPGMKKTQLQTTNK